MRRGGQWALLGIVLILMTSVVSAAPAGTAGVVHFTAAGDYNANSNTSAVLNAMAAADPDLNLALGDLSYGATPTEEAWCDFVTARVGAGFPFELLAGNHESNGQDGHINNFSSCLPNQLPGLVGTYGRQFYVDVPKVDPLVRYVMISPNLPFPDGTTWNYNAGTARYAWTAAAIDGARTAGIPWVVVGMHKPCLSIGQYACDPGADITDLMLSKRVDLVLHGHEHLYQRTHQLGLGSGCSNLAIDSYDADCVVTTSSSMAAGAGTVFATIGTGGVSLRDINPDDTEAPYFAAATGANTTATFGFLDVTATLDTLSASFQGAAGGAFTDSFSLTKGANQAPTASFTSSTSGLTASFDGSGSFDTDGTISGYAWTFGDGGTGTGATVSHTYAAEGTYDVTLTVTDDDGATGSVTKQVTASSSQEPTVIGLDDYERTVSSGWGTANTGGSWSGSGGSASGVSSGTGRLTMGTAGAGPTMYLPGVSTTDLDLRAEYFIDKLPTGGSSSFSSTMVLRRVAGVGDYRTSAQIMANGEVRLRLSRGGTALTTGVVPGLTYTAGTVLNVRAQATGTSPTTLRVKLWSAGTTEPSSWLLTATDSQSGLQTEGSLAVQSYLSSSATNAPIISRYDNLRAALASTVQ